MAVGPGKYDALCGLVRMKAFAEGAVVIIINGNKGSGFSCQVQGGLVLNLPELLEDMARQIRESEGAPN